MKRFGEPFKATMANGLKQEFRICEKCGLWVPNDKQVLLDHSESERRKGEGMNEIELKQDIIKRLVEIQNIVRKHHNTEFKESEDFIRGFILGAEAMQGVKLPSHWIDEIIKETRKGEGS